MINFYLNDKLVKSNNPSNTILLDFIRSYQKLKGTKIGCREGDCGACTVLVGSINPLTNKLDYKSITSCLTLLGHIQNKHVVTIEGINQKDISQLTPIQHSFVENGATQCGFCTPGFIVSATGYFLSGSKSEYEKLVHFLDGNICRCTGYKSIERACEKIDNNLSPVNDINENLSYLVEKNVIPSYFLSIEERLLQLQTENPEMIDEKVNNSGSIIMGGGTDLLVQIPDKIIQSSIIFNSNNKIVKETSGAIIMDGSITTEEFFTNEVINKVFPDFQKFKKLVASRPIRNIGTIAGNIVNASPIGDLTIILLALNASIFLKINTSERELPLKEFFLDYKTLAKDTNEIITKISIPKPDRSNRYYFNFEKVSKRTHLDIASVNSAIFFEITNAGFLKNVSISAGGISPVPKFLEKTSKFLESKKLNSELISEAMELAKTEVKPISDIRGSKEYKLLLLGQLILTHLITLLPEYVNFEEVYA